MNGNYKSGGCVVWKVQSHFMLFWGCTFVFGFVYGNVGLPISWQDLKTQVSGITWIICHFVMSFQDKNIM